jgi:hypothetical protein
MCTVLLPPGGYPIAVKKCINITCSKSPSKLGCVEIIGIADHYDAKIFKVTIKDYNKQCQNTMKNATTYRINEEIKSLYKKKHTSNEYLYHLHLQCANQLPSYWDYIQTNIDEKVHVMNNTGWSAVPVKSTDPCLDAELLRRYYPLLIIINQKYIFLCILIYNIYLKPSIIFKI